MTSCVILRFRRQKTYDFYSAFLVLLFIVVGTNGQTCSQTTGCAPPLGDLTVARVINVTSGYQGEPSNCAAALHTAGCLNDGDYTTHWSSAQYITGEAFVTLNFPQSVTIENTSVWLPPFTALEAFVLERSKDFGQTWSAYRYYATSCNNIFLKNATDILSPPPNTTEAICVEVWSMLQSNRADFSIGSQLSAGVDTVTVAGYRTVTNIRLKLVVPNHLLQNYEILEWTVTGSCMCNGHASRCIPFQGDSNRTVVHSGCLCEHNTTGDQCERCAVGYYSLPWRPGNATAANACEMSPTIGTDISTVSPTGVAIPGSIIGIYLGVPISLIALATLCGVLVCFGFRYSKAKKMLLYTDIGYNVRGERIAATYARHQDVLIESFRNPGYTAEDTSSAAYATIGDLEVAIRTMLTQTRSNDVENPREPHEYEVPKQDERDLYTQLNKQSIKWIPRGEIIKSVKIGCGQFGDLYEGVWTSPSRECEVVIEAFPSSNPDSKVKFLHDATIMAQLNHPNVIKLLGIITEEKPLTLIFELKHSCNLSMCLAHLKIQIEEIGPTDAFGQLLSYSQQTACGLLYLTSKSLFHTGFSAQKVLVTENNICIITDVGKSEISEEDYYVPGIETTTSLCTAPETIHYKKYSTASDVWSYGCLLYEIWSVGHKLFEGMTNERVIEEIDAGYRLPPPPGCPFMIYYIMIKCWNPDALARPYFRDIQTSLSQNQSFVCHIPNEALLTHPQAGVLGAPLEAGKNMYIDIQNTYTIHR